MFNKYIKNCTVGRYRLLILNDHDNYITFEFNQYCLDYLIIVICISSYLLHLLQLLNVDCFSIFKYLYGKHIKTLMSFGVNQIDKQKFLSIYQQVHAEILHQNNV